MQNAWLMRKISIPDLTCGSLQTQVIDALLEILRLRSPLPST